jgi:ribosomal-protein-alanine N-acetyltransferase
LAEIEVRRMTEADLDAITEIERDLFALPWSRTSFLFEVSDNRTSYAITALVGGEVVGYAVAWFLVDELHVGNVAVARSRQGEGIGKLLVGRLFAEGAARKTAYATLEVRVGNVRAIQLYRRYGFRGIAIRKRYYSNDGEDALVMMADIGGGGAGGPTSEEADGVAGGPAPEAYP